MSHGRREWGKPYSLPYFAHRPPNEIRPHHALKRYPCGAEDASVARYRGGSTGNPARPARLSATALGRLVRRCSPSLLYGRQKPHGSGGMR